MNRIHFLQVCECVIDFQMVDNRATPMSAEKICDVHLKPTLQESWDFVRADNLRFCQFMEALKNDLPKDYITEEDGFKQFVRPVGYQWKEDRNLILILPDASPEVVSLMESKNYTVKTEIDG